MRFSKTKLAFYPEDLHYPSLPTDLVTISDDDYIKILDDMPNGNLCADKNGFPFVEIIKTGQQDKALQQYIAIDAHIQTCIKSRDFDDIGQVALCCVDGNGYQVEALAVSAWIRECWKIQEVIKTGELVFNSVDEAIAALPAFDILA